MQELKDERLCRAACKCARQNPALGLRGIPTLDESQIPSPPCFNDATTMIFGEDWDAGGRYYTDSSGGDLTKDPILRRVGFGAWRFDKVSDISGKRCNDLTMMFGPLLGDDQTVNRGELWAVIRVLQNIRVADGIWTTVCTDSAYVIGGCCVGEAENSWGMNYDL